MINIYWRFEGGGDGAEEGPHVYQEESRELLDKEENRELLHHENKEMIKSEPSIKVLHFLLSRTNKNLDSYGYFTETFMSNYVIETDFADYIISFNHQKKFGATATF